MTEDIEQKRKQLTTTNEYADYYRNELGVNCVYANTRNKITDVPWEEMQGRPISLTLHDKWKNDNKFEQQGIGIVLGKVFHNNSKKTLQFICIDLDGQDAIDKFCNLPDGKHTLEQLSYKLLIEQHRDD